MNTYDRSDEHGAALVEFALVLVPLLMIVIGAIAFGLTLGLQQSTTHAAAAAARAAAVVSAPDAATRAAAIEVRVDEVVAQQLSWLGGVAPAAETIVSDEPDRVTVTVAGENPFHTIGIFGVRPPAEVTSSATIDLEDL